MVHLSLMKASEHSDGVEYMYLVDIEHEVCVHGPRAPSEMFNRVV